MKKQTKKNLTPAQKITLWVNRAQKATPLQTTGVWHVMGRGPKR